MSKCAERCREGMYSVGSAANNNIEDDLIREGNGGREASWAENSIPDDRETSVNPQQAVSTVV